ncbi:MAG TPA: hypothetical protein PK490_21565 [Prosthecobacter sp.]|nr:hypothetical protein [Prosthecobacter sp.]
MTFPPRFQRLLLAALIWLGGAVSATAEWLVYELKFTPDSETVNFSFYSSAYVIAPLNGGPVSIVLATEEGGQYYALAESSGKFFVAANAQARKAVFSALALKGTSQAFYTASGHLNRSLLLKNAAGQTRTWRVAETLAGRLMSADDESERGPAEDGSYGVVGGAVITGALREDLTALATAQFGTQAAATAWIVELLEKYGYLPDEGAPAAPPEAPTPRKTGAEVIDPSLFPSAN